jgi:type IV pilus assembly protein PilO
LEFELFKPGNEVVGDFYAEMPISIKVIGAYHDLGAFATDISKLSRIVTLNDISIETGAKDTRISNKRRNYDRYDVEAKGSNSLRFSKKSEE